MAFVLRCSRLTLFIRHSMLPRYISITHVVPQTSVHIRGFSSATRFRFRLPWLTAHITGGPRVPQPLSMHKCVHVTLLLWTNPCVVTATETNRHIFLYITSHIHSAMNSPCLAETVRSCDGQCVAPLGAVDNTPVQTSSCNCVCHPTRRTTWSTPAVSSFCSDHCSSW